MKIEPRYTKGKDGSPTPRGAVLVAESKEESEILDSIFGSTVGADGLIAAGEFEVRLSDGYADHYIYLGVKND